MRRIWVVLLGFFLGGQSLALGPGELRSAYDVLRNGLCALRITCILPQDMLFPADWGRDVNPRLSQSREVLMIGRLEDLRPAIQYLDTWLNTTDPQRQQARPRVFMVIPQEQMVWMRSWTENPRLAQLVNVVASSNENEPLGIVGRSGLPLLILDNQVAYMPSWYKLDGPVMRQVLTWGMVVVNQVRQANQRRQEVR
jgi:hypothetical protein